MRGTRWLLILAILAILGGVGATYRLQRRILASQAAPRPARMPLDLRSSAEDWVYSQTENGKPKAILRARKFGQAKDTGITELEGVRLRIAGKEGDTYDIVNCEKAQFTQSSRLLYSEGQVEITLNIPVEGPPKRKPVTIRTSGLNYDVDSSKASTERLAEFEFENGTGKAVGASYDPAAKLLHLSSQVEVNWKAPGPHARPMKVEAGELNYQEGSGKIWLSPRARLTRDNTVVETETAVVTLENGAIRAVDASKGHGTDSYPNRKLEYSADQIWLNFSEKGVVERVSGEPNAHVVNTSETSVTTMNADHVDLEFSDANGESMLTHVLAKGNEYGRIEAAARRG